MVSKGKDDNNAFILQIPNLNLSEEFFYSLGQIYEKICDSTYNNIVLDFAKCSFISPAFISYLGGLKEYFKHKSKKIIFSTPNENIELNKYFASTGIRKYFSDEFSDDLISSNSIPFSRIDTLDDDAISDYIANITDLAPVSLSQTASEQIFQNIFEIFANANEHSEHTEGIFASGSWLPDRKELVFSIYDTGIGIPQKIKKDFPYISSFDAFVWSLQRGNSTSQLEKGVPRGLGLHNLSEFIQLNGGTLHILSNDIYYTYPNIGRVGISPFITPGTLISVQIRADYKHLYLTKGDLNG